MNYEDHPTSKIDKVIFYGIIVLLIFAPLAFGSVHVWAYSIIELGVFSLLALWFADRLFFSGYEKLFWVKTPLNLILILFLGLIGLQLVPLPASVVALISPHTYADKTQVFSILAKTGDIPVDGLSWMTLSYYPHATLVEWLKVCAYCGMFFLVLNIARTKEKIDAYGLCPGVYRPFRSHVCYFPGFSITPKVWWWKSQCRE